MNPHYCLTSDGFRIVCLCSTGRNHVEDEMDRGLDWEPEDGDDDE